MELRPWRSEDAQSLQRAVAPSPDLALQLGGVDLRSLAACVAFIEERLLPTDESRIDWAVCVDSIVVGNIGLSNIEHRHDTAWVHYWVAAGQRRRGLATAALATMAAYGFEELGVFRIELGHRVDNVASCRVATKAGFAAEGIERSKLRYGDLRFDAETHARLATDPAR